MSEKRYTVGLQSKTIFDMKTELYLFDNKIICELLNAQNSLICEQQSTILFLQDEIDELKKDIDIYEYEEKKHSKTARKLYEENEQLQKELKELNRKYIAFSEATDKRLKEMMK